MTINIHISKANQTLSVDWDAMPEAAQRHIIEYGLKQKLNDAGSSATAKELGAIEAGKQAFAMAEVVLASLMEGKLTVRTKAASQSFEDKTFAAILAGLAKAKGLPEDITLEAFCQATGAAEAHVADKINEVVARKVAAREAARLAREEAKSIAVDI